MDAPLISSTYSFISTRVKTVEIKYRIPNRDAITHIVIDSTRIKVFGYEAWKASKHGMEKRRILRKLRLAGDMATH